MENTTYAGRLRYLDADHVDDTVVNFDGLNVYGSDDEKIGDVEGFIIDAEAKRVNYIVIDAGGWFTSRQLLLPIGHATLSPDRDSLRTDVTRDTLRRLPEYQKDRFKAFTDDELRAFERSTVAACCPDEPLEDVSVNSWGYESRRHYGQPEWWKHRQYETDRMGQESRHEGLSAGAATASTTGAAASMAEDRNRDLVTARENIGAREEVPVRTEVSVGGDRLDTDRDRDTRDHERTADDGVSPHFEKRAQPGDVLGIETGGESTGVGDTAEDEDKRRRDAERSARDT
ncbi:hypothetical protein BH24ACI4_BH24ACI4_07260 [soil metagenome]